MFRIPMNTENYLESTKNHLSSNGIFSKDLQRCTFSKRFQNMLKIESSPCSTISIWLRKDIAWNVFRILTSWSEITQRNLCWDIGLFSLLVKRKHGMERKITNLKNGAILQMSWSPTSKTADLHSSELPVRWIVGDVRFTSARILQMQNFYFARSLLHISSVSTERSLIGVINWLGRFLVNHFQVWRSPPRKRMSSKIKSWRLKKWIRWFKHLRRMFKQWEIDCVITKKM